MDAKNYFSDLDNWTEELHELPAPEITPEYIKTETRINFPNKSIMPHIRLLRKTFLTEYLSLLPETSIDFFRHDLTHIVSSLGIMSTNTKTMRESSFGFLLEATNHSEFYSQYIEKYEKDAKYFSVNLEKDDLSSFSKEKQEEIIQQAYMFQEALQDHRQKIKNEPIFRTLYSDEVLERAINDWSNDFSKKIPSYKFLYTYAGELMGFTSPKAAIGEILNGIKGSLDMSFFPFTKTNEDHKIDIQVTGDYDVEVEQAGHIFSFVYNLAKNAMKHAEELYLHNRTHTPGIVALHAEQQDDKLYVLVNQSFSGIEKEAYAKLGYNMVKNNHSLKDMLPQETIQRYETWIESPFGNRYGDMTIGDFANLVFLPYISGAQIKYSKTSGTGLFALKTLLKEKQGSIDLTYNLGDKGLQGEGFLLTLNK